MRHDFAHSNLRDRASAVREWAKINELNESSHAQKTGQVSADQMKKVTGFLLRALRS
jgi:hypothetical protein